MFNTKVCSTFSLNNVFEQSLYHDGYTQINETLFHIKVLLVDNHLNSEELAIIEGYLVSTAPNNQLFAKTEIYSTLLNNSHKFTIKPYKYQNNFTFSKELSKRIWNYLLFYYS